MATKQLQGTKKLANLICMQGSKISIKTCGPVGLVDLLIYRPDNEVNKSDKFPPNFNFLCICNNIWTKINPACDLWASRVFFSVAILKTTGFLCGTRAWQIFFRAWTFTYAVEIKVVHWRTLKLNSVYVVRLSLSSNNYLQRYILVLL